MFRLLIVDDEKNERDCLLYLIQNAQLPFEVREAENGADALRILEEWTADVILSDVQMPVMGGLEFLREACALYPKPASSSSATTRNLNMPRPPCTWVWKTIS